MALQRPEQTTGNQVGRQRIQQAEVSVKLNVWGVFLVMFGAAAWFSYAWNPGVNLGFQESASVLAFVTMMAVSIERILEFFWSVVGGTHKLGGFWPLSEVVKRAKEVEDKANELLKAPFTEATQLLQRAKEALKDKPDELAEVTARLAELEPLQKRLESRLKAVTDLAPGSTRVALASSVAADAQTFLSQATVHARVAVSDLKTTVDAAGDAINLAVGIVGSFQDNPARRSASLLLGTTMGMLAAGFVGLNMFTAILRDSADQATGTPGSILFGRFGVMVTGLVIGLGSNPTHEIVKALQNYKKSRQDSTVAEVTTETPGGATAGGRDSGRREDVTRALVADGSVKFFSITGPYLPQTIIPDQDTVPAPVRRKAFVRLRSTD